jgi:hypothetical protein
MKFIQEQDFAIGYRFRDMVYKVKCFIHPHNVIKIRSLTSEWHDKDTILEEAMFQLLVDYVEKEKCFDTIDWDSDDFNKKISETIRGIYKYVKEERPALQKAHKDALDSWYKSRSEDIAFHFNCKSEPVPGEFSEKSMNCHYKSPRTEMLHTALNGLEKGLTDSDTYMLTELVKIRGALWT